MLSDDVSWKSPVAVWMAPAQPIAGGCMASSCAYAASAPRQRRCTAFEDAVAAVWMKCRFSVLNRDPVGASARLALQEADSELAEVDEVRLDSRMPIAGSR